MTATTERGRRLPLFPTAEVALLPGCKHCPPTDAAFRDLTATRVRTFRQQQGASGNAPRS